MAVSKLTCPSCMASLKLPNPVEAGKQIRCPKCKEVFRVPEDETEVVDMKEATEPETESEPKPAPARSKPAPRQAVTRSRPTQGREKEWEDDEEDDDQDYGLSAKRSGKETAKRPKDNVLFAGLVAGLIGAVLAVGIYLIAKTTAGKPKKVESAPQREPFQKKSQVASAATWPTRSISPGSITL